MSTDEAATGFESAPRTEIPYSVSMPQTLRIAMLGTLPAGCRTEARPPRGASGAKCACNAPWMARCCHTSPATPRSTSAADLEVLARGGPLDGAAALEG